MCEPLISINQARVLLGRLKNCKRVSYPAIVRLVKHEGLPTVANPFSPGTWAFQESAIEAWFEAYINRGVTPLRGPGRPRKRAVVGSSIRGKSNA